MFQKNRIFLSLIPVLCSAALFLGGQAPDVSGIWSLRVSNNDGTYRTTYLKLRQGFQTGP
jgi:hypothetical protein